MVDFTNSIAVAQRLISANGRSITLLAFSETPANAAQPWNGPTDPVTPSASLTLDAVFVPPSGVNQLGLGTTVDDLLKRSDQIAIVSPGATADLRIYDSILDDSEYWTIDRIQELKPSTQLVLGFIGVSR